MDRSIILLTIFLVEAYPPRVLPFRSVCLSSLLFRLFFRSTRFHLFQGKSGFFRTVVYSKGEKTAFIRYWMLTIFYYQSRFPLFDRNRVCQQGYELYALWSTQFCLLHQYALAASAVQWFRRDTHPRPCSFSSGSIVTFLALVTFPLWLAPGKAKRANGTRPCGAQVTHEMLSRITEPRNLRLTVRSQKGNWKHPSSVTLSFFLLLSFFSVCVATACWLAQ